MAGICRVEIRGKVMLNFQTGFSCQCSTSRGRLQLKSQLGTSLKERVIYILEFLGGTAPAQAEKGMGAQV